MKKSSKKKLVPFIVAGCVALVFGGLIYLGISAFPELLMSEEELLAQEASGAIANGHRLVIEEAIEEEPQGFTDGLAANDAVVLDNVEFVYSPASISHETNIVSETKNNRSKDYFVLDIQPVSHEDAVPAITSINDSSNEHISYSSHYESDITPTNTVKTKKVRANKNQTTRSNEAVVETSLLVIGAVDLLSMILIKRKKHLFR